MDWTTVLHDPRLVESVDAGIEYQWPAIKLYLNF